jgi:hypothetical protein
MYANSGKISINELLATMLSPMDKPRRNLLKDATLFLNESYAATLITDIFKGLPLHLRTDRIISTIHKFDVP